MQSLIGLKKVQSQRFLENGKRIPVTLIDVKDNTVVAIQTLDKNKYQAVQLGFSMKKKASKAELGHAKGAKLEKAPKFLREVRIVDESDELPEIGAVLNPAEVFTPGDIVDVSGVSKGKGFQGGVKRHGFHGGPKTHGQSDRHRAPGSIGQGTTPGRVYKGKKMAGRMGVDSVTMENLEIVDVTNDGVLIVKGLVPGIINSMVMVKKVREGKNFVPLQKSPEQLEAEEKVRLEAEEAAAKAAKAAKAAEEAALRDAQDADVTATKEAEKVAAEAAKAEEVKTESAEAEIASEAAEEVSENKVEALEEKPADVVEESEEKSEVVEEEKDGNK